MHNNWRCHHLLSLCCVLAIWCCDLSQHSLLQLLGYLTTQVTILIPAPLLTLYLNCMSALSNAWYGRQPKVFLLCWLEAFFFFFFLILSLDLFMAGLYPFPLMPTPSFSLNNFSLSWVLIFQRVHWEQSYSLSAFILLGSTSQTLLVSSCMIDSPLP